MCQSSIAKERKPEHPTKRTFWKEVLERFTTIKKDGFWIINLPFSYAIGWSIIGSCVTGSTTEVTFIKIAIVFFFIAFFKFLWSLLSVVKKRISELLTTSFWGVCIKEIARTQEILMIPISYDKQRRKQVMISAIESLQTIMNTITGCTCGISIKIPQNPKEDPLKWEMLTLLRDPIHFERDNHKYKNTVHHVRNNTAFLWIVNNLKDGNKGYKYINNDRGSDPSYTTTSQDCYPSLPQYVSEIVCPILSPGEDDAESLYGLRGFLCVDCEKTYPFRKEEITASLIGMVAYMLQPILSK